MTITCRRHRREFARSIRAAVFALPELAWETICGHAVLRAKVGDLARGVRAGDHHLLIGHFDDYESMNVHARSQAKRAFHGMTAAQSRVSAAWKKLAAARPAHFAAMAEEERQKIREMMDNLMPA